MKGGGCIAVHRAAHLLVVGIHPNHHESLAQGKWQAWADAGCQQHTSSTLVLP